MTLKVLLMSGFFWLASSMAHALEAKMEKSSFNCPTPSEIGSWVLPHSLKESSGLAYLKGTGWLYQIADSGNEAAVYRTDLNGQSLHKTSLDGIKNIDFEDLSDGDCPSFLKMKDQSQCLFVADTGDNFKSRDEVYLYILDAVTMDSDYTRPVSSIVLNYPDRAHDAESFAIHPKSKLGFILTKEYEGLFFKSGLTSTIFKINWDDVIPGKPYKMVRVGEINIPNLAGHDHSLPTSMTFSPDGKWLFVLNYKNVLVFDASGWAEGKGTLPEVWVKDKNYFVLNIEEQKQMEAIALIDDDKFVVTSEGKKERAITYSCHQKSLSLR